MNFPLIFNLIGAVLMVVSLCMFIPVGVSAFMSQPDLEPLLFSAVLTLAFGIVLNLGTRRHAKEEFRHRDVFTVVTLTWLSVSFFGCLPYLFSGAIGSFTDAYFESMAGFTTTGATVLEDIEALPMGLLFWRSFTQWLGGMGIILFALAVMPFLGSRGMQLFKAEVPEIAVERLRPRLIDTAKHLWYIYLALTGAACVLYLAGGMSIFDAVCHAFTSLATGGFSTKNASIGHFQSPFIDGVCTVFMFLAGVNYALYFYGLRGKPGRFLRSGEFKFYATMGVGATLLIAFSTYGTSYSSVGESLRYASFQAVSIMTGTGYTTADYEAWMPFAKVLLVLLMFCGGMIGSTSGGMKQVRILLMFKQGYRELYQIIHPHAVTTVKVDGKVLSKEVLGSIWGFLFLFVLICAVATLAMAALGEDMVTSFSTVLSAMSNVGPALGEAGPTDNYASMPTAGKWILSFCMLVGRLEIFTVLVLLMPRFWRK
jgi:trk system potassium uptake protein TrkH